jgi:hypothetical protein
MLLLLLLLLLLLFWSCSFDCCCCCCFFGLFPAGRQRRSRCCWQMYDQHLLTNFLLRVMFVCLHDGKGEGKGEGPAGSPLPGECLHLVMLRDAPTDAYYAAAAALVLQDGKGEGKGEGPAGSPLPGGRPLTPGAAAAGLSTDRYGQLARPHYYMIKKRAAPKRLGPLGDSEKRGVFFAGFVMYSKCEMRN